MANYLSKVIIDNTEALIKDSEARDAIARARSVFVTPEMFGAVGDGVTDDSDAINTCLTHKNVIFSHKTYLVSKTLNVSKGTDFFIDAHLAKIHYTGSDYAIKLEGVVNSNIKFGTITAENGGCINLYSENDISPLQYVNISFVEMYANSNYDCIHTNMSGGWINEIRVYSGRFSHGLNGINIDHSKKTGQSINRWSIVRCGFEGVKTGITINAGSADIWNININDCRCLESTEKFIKTSGNVRRSVINGSSIATNLLDLSNNSTFTINAELIDNTGDVLCSSATFLHGAYYYNNYHYIDYTFTLNTNDTNIVFKTPTYDKKIINAVIVYSDDIYYLINTDGIVPILGINNNEVSLCKTGNRSVKATRNITIRILFES